MDYESLKKPGMIKDIMFGPLRHKDILKKKEKVYSKRDE